MVPEEVLGDDRVEVVRFDGETATAHVPPGGKLRIDGWPRDERELEIARGHVVEVTVGAFVARLTRVRAGTKPAARAAREPAAQRVRRHLPARRSRTRRCSRSSRSSRRRSAPPRRTRTTATASCSCRRCSTRARSTSRRRTPDDSRLDNGGDVERGPADARRRGPGGQGDAPRTRTRGGRPAGHATPETATLPREAVLAEAAELGPHRHAARSATQAIERAHRALGHGAERQRRREHGRATSSAAPSATRSAPAAGASPASARGAAARRRRHRPQRHRRPRSHGACVAAATATASARGTASRAAGTRLQVPRRSARPAPSPTNGHLPPEIIQRIVRQNFGRFRFCYENGLRRTRTSRAASP